MPTNEYDDFARADAGVSLTEGLLTPGTIDLSARPVVRNDDGTISTVRSMSFNENGQEILIPTVAADGSGILDDSAAVAQYRRTGQHLGKFDTPEHATQYAQRLHEEQAVEYGPGSANDDYAQMANGDAQARDVAVQAAVNKALYTMPDDAATVKSMADRSGLPEPVVERHRDEVSRVLRMRDIRQALADSPILTRQMTDPEFARLAHDDVESLSAVEREFGVMRETPRPEPTILNYIRGLWSSFAQGTEQVRLGVQLQGADLLSDGSEDSRLQQENLLRQYRQADSRIQATTPAFESGTAQGIYGGFSSLLQQLPGLAAAIATRNPYLALGFAGTQVQAQSYGKYRARGGTPGEAFLGGTAEGALEVATEMLPMGFLVDRFGKTGAKEFLGGLLLRELPSEQIATFTQDAVDTAIANPTKTWGDFFSERGNAAYQTALATLVQSGALAGTHSLARRVVGDSLKVQEAAQGAGFLARLTELAKASKTAQRTPDTFEKFVADAAEDGPIKEVYISADALMQSGLADQVAAVSPAVAAQLPLASQTGGQIAIPVEEYAARIAPTEFNQGLLDHLKTDPEGFSQAEAQTYLQSQRDELEQEVEKAAQNQQAVDTFKASADVVRTQVKAQLEATGRFTPQVNDAYASLWANFFSGQAARLTNTTPEDLFKQYYPTVVAENVASGPVLDQGGGLDALRQQWRADGIDASVSEHDGTITLSKIIVPNGQRGAGKGTAAMQALVGYADRTGQHVALSPSADFGGNKKRLVAFYKRFGFVENKGKNRAFSTSESMHREAPGRVLEQAARGSFNPSTNTIALLKAADLSTFLHESGHFFLEVQTDIAGKLRQQAELFGMDALKPEERQLLADTDALMKWFGVGTLTDWYSMDLEQKRSYHEQFARGFESYLFDGKAPSIELQGLFQRFRAWLVNVYKDLKALNVTLTDEVRSVFDRMLASEDQIALAEQGRSMMPLFESAEQAGMTSDEFAAYQALGADATADAIQDLQAKGLRDMQWLHNAQSRVLKELQKEAAARRAEMRMEARREIMSQPVYRAWQFLTGKISTDDKITPVKPPSSHPDVLDPAVDSLFVAIAKLGGLDRAEVKSEWGIDSNETTPPVFGKPVIRAKGGRSLDDMRQALIEQGYLSQEDATGDWNPREFEDRFDAELRGDTQYSFSHDFAADQELQAGAELANPGALTTGRLDASELSSMALPAEVMDVLKARKMVAKNGLHPDIVAALPGIEMTSGDELVRKLAEAEPPQDTIAAVTDVKMLERYGELSSPEAIAKAADKAVHNEARARFAATEAEVLQRLANPTAPTGKIDRRGRAVSRGILLPAAREFAQNVIARVRVRDLRPAQYASAEARAAQNSARAAKAGDVVTAAAEKRNQVIQQQLTKATYDAQDEVGKAVRYLRKFDNTGTRKNIDPDYLDQIDQLLERFDLRASVSNKEAARRKSLIDWVQAQQELGFDPDVPDALLAQAQRKPYRELTLTELRGVLDTVKQIEHLGRLKTRLLTAADNRAFAQVVDEISASITDNAARTVKERRTSDRGRLADIGTLFRNFTADHRKFASLVREMDGWQDGGPMWEYLAQSMNRAGDREAVMREQATIELSNLLKPILKTGKLNEKTFFRSVGKSFTREERIGIALNMGNETNRERLISGEGLPPAAQREILDTLTKEEMDFVQSIWDYLDSYWSEIVAKQRRVQGITSEKVQALPVETRHGTYRGGYYPIKYDALRSTRAEADTAAEVQRQVERGLYASSTTRRGHEKARAASVGRPMRYDLGVITQHVDQVVHDLSWHEYLIDANRLLKAPAIDKAIRSHYGPELLRTMRETLTDIAVGNLASQSSGERILNYIRKGATITGLGWRLTTSLMQPLGLTQSMVRVGPKWVARGAWRWFGDTAHFENSVRKINEKSDFMRLRAKTMQREINEIRNRVKGKDSRLEASYFYLIQKAQLMADVPTWWGQYEKSMAEDGMTEERAAAMADQAVRDSQGGGQTGDLSKVQRGSAGWMLFTNFYSFFNTTYNLTAEAVGRTDFKKPGEVGLLGVDLLLLYTIPALLGTIVHSAFAGDWDDKDFGKKLVYDQLTYLLGTMVVVREAGSAVSGLLGMYSDYSGPAAVRLFGNMARFAKQVSQGEADEAFWKALNSLGGIVFHYPAGQINNTLQGINAMLDGRTSNPGALVVGPPRK
ncbi:hypothetical protein ABS755_08085 [Castellaniella sp. FW104-16D08]|uniref:hypothetical protein n=1 Tax=unclassified Castellaniella TaxID=2617606 RepID=UPI0033153EA6